MRCREFIAGSAARWPCSPLRAPGSSAIDDSICRMTHMNDLEDRPPPAVGAYWIKEEDYLTLLRISDDGDKMPLTWKEWLKVAEEMERGLKAYGHVVLRVHIDPNTFPDWCAAHGTSLGREGRKRFVVRL
jgi:hypothetical protein